MENPYFHYGKPSISMGHLYHGYVSHNQMVISISKLLMSLLPIGIFSWESITYRQFFVA